MLLRDTLSRKLLRRPFLEGLRDSSFLIFTYMLIYGIIVYYTKGGISMDEFRKPYEYIEEKRGFIQLFIIMLILIDLLQAPLYIMPVYRDIKQIHALGVIFVAMGILYVLFILFTALTCYMLEKNMVTISKIYLVVRVFFTVFCIIILFYNNYNDKEQLKTITELIVMGLLLPIGFELAFSIGWFLYFLKSKKCKEFAKKQVL